MILQIGPLELKVDLPEHAKSIAKNNKYILVTDKYALKVENVIHQLHLLQFHNIRRADN